MKKIAVVPALALASVVSWTAHAQAQVTWLSHADGDVLSGLETLIVASSATTTSVQFYLGGGLIGTDVDGNDGWQVDYDTTAAPSGPERITAVAFDGSALAGIAPIYINIENDKMHVANVAAQATITSSASWSIEMDVTVVDQNGAPLSGADVAIFCRDQAPQSWIYHATTNGAGTATFEAPLTCSSDRAGCGVVAIDKAGYTYDPTANTSGVGVGFVSPLSC